MAVIDQLDEALGGVAAGSVWKQLGLCLGCDMALQWVLAVFAIALQTEKFYDLAGASTHVLLSIITLKSFSFGADEGRGAMLTAMVMVWGLRLSSFLFMRVIKDGKDRRFNVARHSPPLFFAFWTIQGLWIIIGATPVLLVNLLPSQTPFGAPTDIVGAAMWVVGFLFEYVADAQKTEFKAKEENHKRFITTGLWSWSRHPNYFGEILLWCGIFVGSLGTISASTQWLLLGAASPAFTIFLLTSLSGIPLLEAAAKKRWGDDPAYQAYKKATSVLIPMPPKKAKAN